MRAIDCHPPWTARLHCISWCWTAGRKTEITDPSLSRLSAFWTSSSGTQAAWRSSPVQPQGDGEFALCTCSEGCIFYLQLWNPISHFLTCFLWYLYSQRLKGHIFSLLLNWSGRNLMQFNDKMNSLLFL